MSGHLEGSGPKSSGNEGDLQKGLDGLLNDWWVRYCPACSTKYPFSDEVCSRDGKELRDLSISSCNLLEEGTGPEGGSGGEALRSDLGSMEDGEFPPLGDPGQGEGAAESPAIPKVLGGRWSRGRRQGSGNFGAFYEGFHKILGNQVGIKILRRRFTTGSGRRQFYEEALRVSRLNHPNIVKVFDYGEEEERPYLIMEYLAGKPLHRAFADGDVGLGEGVEVIRQAAVALVTAHQGTGTGGPLVHLDLKPEHIFVERIQGRWHAKVIDFGIAEIVSSPSTDPEPGEDGGPPKARIAGTLPYMAPERWQGVVDPRCDIYSLGIILYEMVAGRRPFRATEVAALRRMHEEENPPPPSLGHAGGRSAALRELDRIILWCLEKEPERRPASAEILAMALERWQARPRHGLGWRLAEAMLAPAILAVLALGLLYWGPWEKVVLPESLSAAEPGILGENNGLKVSPYVNSLGYDQGKVDLFLSGEGTTARIPLGTAGAAIVFSWKSLEGALKGPIAEGYYEARVEITGWFGRRARSDPFGLILDLEPPMIESIEGGARLEGDTLWLWGSEVDISSIRDLDVRNSLLGTLRSSDPIRPDAKTRSVRFRIPQDWQPETVTISLVDTIGNTTVSGEYQVRRMDMPFIASQGKDFYTNQDVYPLELPIGGDCGKVLVDDRKPEPGQRPIWQIAMDRPVKELKVELWSVANLDRDKPDRTETIRILHLKQDLRIHLTGDDPGNLSLKVSNQNDEEVPLEELQLKPSLILDQGNDGGMIDVNCMVTRNDGRLNVPTIGDHIEKGKLYLTLTVEDRFGNRGIIVKAFAENAKKPDVKDLRVVATEDGVMDGSPEKPFLHKDDKKLLGLYPQPQAVDLEAAVEYMQIESLRFTLCIGDPDPRSARDSLDLEKPSIGEGRCRFSLPRDKLLSSLVPGENALYLLAIDENSPTLQGQKDIKVFYDKPLWVAIQPRSGTVDSKAIRVAIGLDGPTPEGVKAWWGPDQSPILLKMIDPRTYQGILEIPLWGAAVVTVQVDLKNGCTHQEKRTYTRKPVSGAKYTFPVEEVGDLVLEYREGAAPGSVLFLTTLGDCAKLIDLYRAAQDRAAQGGSRGGPGAATWEEADGIAAWLTEKLRKAGRLGSGQDQKACMAWFEDLRESPAPPESWEWVSGPRPKALSESDFRYLVVQWVARSGKILGANETDRYVFRLKLPAQGDGNGLGPENATGAEESK